MKHDAWLTEQLHDDAFAAAYLTQAAQDLEPTVFTAALRAVIDARGGLAKVAEARDALIAQKPLLKGYGTDNIRASMINGKAALAVIYSGDAFCCIDENADLDFAVPKEGSNVWFDNVVIPKTAKNVEAAHAFINFLNDAKIAARNTEYIYYSTPNAGAMALLDPYFTDNETYNPSEETLARCTVFHDLGEFVGVFNDAWEQVKMTKAD